MSSITNSSSSFNPDLLLETACKVAIEAAGNYLRKHSLQVDDGVLAGCLKSRLYGRYDEAARDAQDAIDLGMHAIAEATFVASMRLAGIEAAKDSVAFEQDMLAHRWEEV